MSELEQAKRVDRPPLVMWSAEYVATVGDESRTVRTDFWTNETNLQLYVKPTVFDDGYVCLELVDTRGDVYWTVYDPPTVEPRRDTP